MPLEHFAPLLCMSILFTITRCNLEYEMFTQQWGETPLHHAVTQQNADMVAVLLKAGSKVNETDKVSMH